MNNTNRLFLNFGNNDRNYQQNPQDRAYPTTPSTFPNPIFPSQGQGGAPQAQNNPQQPYSTGFAPAGYFMNNPYPPSYPQQPASAVYQQAPQAPQTSYQQRPAGASNNDATNGLVHQFSHQNLGGRSSPYDSRQASPSQRPRTAGASGQQASYGSYLTAPMPSNSVPQPSLPDFQGAPERNPDRYGPHTQNNQKKCAQLAADFFKDSVKRARDRNVR